MPTPPAIAAIQAMDKTTLTPAQAAQALNMDPGTLRWQAKTNPLRLGFPVIINKSRVKIPRIPFLRYLGYDA